MKPVPVIWLLFILLIQSCNVPYYTYKENVEEALPVNTNFELIADTLLVYYDPGMDSWFELYKGDHVAVAEFSELNIAGLEQTWIKIAHSQDKQGWITDGDLMRNFIPADSISQLIHFLGGHKLLIYMAVIVLLFNILFIWLAGKKRIAFVLINDMDSIYPLLLCLIVSTTAVLYQSIQIFTPQDWLHYYFVPSLSPSNQPTLIAGFLLSLWLILVSALAAVDVATKQLSGGTTFVYLTGLLFFSIFCYLFFFITVPFYGVGYGVYAAFVLYYLYRVCKEVVFRFRCGNCGRKMKKRGVCPRCGAMNR